MSRYVTLIFRIEFLKLHIYSIIYHDLGITCGKAWTFTRVPQYEFVGTANQEVNNGYIVNPI